jgi:hypothetical protein
VEPVPETHSNGTLCENIWKETPPSVDCTHIIQNFAVT